MTRRFDAEVVVEFLVDVAQRRRDPNIVANGKGEAVGLACAVIRVLAEDHDTNVGECGEVEGSEDRVESLVRTLWPQLFSILSSGD